MKKNLKYIFSFLTITALLLVVGCEDDELVPDVSVSGTSVNASYPLDPVSLTGTSFETVQFVFVGDKQALFELDGQTITFLVPETAEVGNNEITLVMPNNYRVKYPLEVLLRPLPVIQNYDAFVPVGGDLVISGTSFNPEYDVVVTIDGIEATITNQTNTNLTVTVPGGIPDDEFIDFEISSIHGSTTSGIFMARENLLSNSQLTEGEGDEFTAWNKLNGGETMTAVIGEDAYDGGRSVRIIGAGSDAWRTQFASDFVPLTFGAEYTIIFWAKAESDNPAPSMRVSASRYTDGSDPRSDYFYSDQFEIATNWQPYSFTFTVDTDLPEHSISLDMGYTDIPFLVDNIALVTGAVGAGGQAPDLIMDGGFEASTLAGNDAGDWEAANGTISLDTDAFCGTNAIMAVGNGTPGEAWRTQLASAPIALDFQGTYEVSFWAKATQDDVDPPLMSVSISRYTDGSDPRSDYFYSHSVEVGDDWTQYSYVFDVETDLTAGHNIVFDLGRSAQTFYIDNVTVREYEDPAGLLADSGFEASTLAGNDAGDWEAANGTISLTTAEAYSGTTSIEAVGNGTPGEAWRTQLASVPVPLVMGSRYTVKFRAKATQLDTDPSELSISVSRYTDGSDPRSDYYYSHPITIGDEWATYTYNFEVMTDLPGGHNIVFDLGRSAQTFYLDDVIVYEIDSEEDSCDD